jgi:pimeloyl-ACP methyl ester carboxylesterase
MKTKMDRMLALMLAGYALLAAPGCSMSNGDSTQFIKKDSSVSATLSSRTSYAEINGKKLAYREVGKGKPIILCNRFRGITDSWDPAFIDSLSNQYRVILFDYSGIGLSSGLLDTTILGIANDVKDLADFLKIETFPLLGWSFGGIVAQTFAVHYPQRVSHTIIIGTRPAGINPAPIDPLFLQTAFHEINDLKDEEILFFEPASAVSRDAARLSHERIASRKTDIDIPVTKPTWERYFKAAGDFSADRNNTREKLGALSTPVLILSGDHDISGPIENWYALTRKMPNMFINVLPSAGHGPHHQYPALSVKYIEAFLSR